MGTEKLLKKYTKSPLFATVKESLKVFFFAFSFFMRWRFIYPNA